MLIIRAVQITVLSLLAAAAVAQDDELPDSAAAFDEDSLGFFEAYLDGAVAAQMEVYDLAGVSIALVLNGEVALTKGYGYADLTIKAPVEPAVHLFRPGSISKLFTWTAIMQLYEQGKLDIDAPVSNYVEQFPIPDQFAPITLKHIMSHTPGLEDGGAGYLFGDGPESLIPLAEALGTYVPAQMWEPGTVASYSNWAAALAGLVVANVSGMSFEDYIDEFIFRPLDMNNSSFHQPLSERLAANMATGYFSENGGLEVLGYEFISFAPAGGLSATAPDIANFMIAHVHDGEFRGRRILQADTARLMHSELFRQHPDVSAMAHGFYEIERNGHRFIGHGGDTISFHSDLVIDPANDFGFYISFNAAEGAAARGAIVNAVLDHFYPASEAPAPTAANALEGSRERLAQVAGSYRINRRSYTKLESITGIVGDINVVPAGENKIVISVPTLGGEFEEIEPYQFRKVNDDMRLVFDTDESGEVERALLSPLPMMSLTRLSWYESGSNHMAVIALALLASLFVLFNTFRNWSRSRATEGLASLATWSAFALSVTNIVFVAAFAGLFATSGMRGMLFDFPPSGLGVVLTLPIVSAFLTLALVVLAVMLWRRRIWNIAKRIRYSYVALVNVLFVFVLNYWNVLGWNYY